MKTHDCDKTTAIPCTQCGKCCLSVFIPVTDEDMERWKREGKEEIVRAMEHSKTVWAGDIIISSEDGKILFTCPLLRWEGRYYTCTIYEERPSVCREYKPGSSELCSQFKIPE
jgi:Fe-S-cluster containining protein